MLTPRAWWYLVALAVGLTVGLAADQPAVAVVCLGLLVWMAAEGVLFLFRARWVSRGLTFQRAVWDERGPVTSLWVGKTTKIRLTVSNPQNLSLPYVVLEDPTPFGLEVIEGEARTDGALGPNGAISLTYTVKAPHAGRVRFEGVRVEISDYHGLFYHVTFLRDVAFYRVLPALVDAEGKTASKKRFNLLPPPGINRMHRPGSGSELLDLRDYMPGDPPKTIAWKVSARRDKLITKEYESEVPLRCTLFVDTSRSVRLGPPGKNALSRLIEVASAVAQANMSARDLTGVCVFDEEGTRVMKPARTRRHLVDMLNTLAEAAGKRTPCGHVPLESLLPLTYAFAQEVYPDLLESRVNHVPGWLPFFVPIPGHWVTPKTSATNWYRWIMLPLATVLFVWLGGAVFVEMVEQHHAFLEFLENVLIPIPPDEVPLGDIEILRPSIEEQMLGQFVWLCLLFPIWILLIRDALPLLFAPQRRRTARQRKKLSALFCQRYDLGPGGLELLMQDDREFMLHMERFLVEHHVPHTPILFDSRGRFLYASPSKVEVLATALTRVVARGHDNELYVLCVDLLDLESRLDPLLRAVKVALARHHQVVVVIPWPADMPLPGARPPDVVVDVVRTRKRKDRRKGARRPPGAPMPLMTAGELGVILERVAERKYQRAFHRLRRTFARMQVPVVCAASDEPIRLILERLDRMRGLHRRRR